MAVPKWHRSKSRQGQRRMHLYIKAQKLAACSHCKKEILPHIVCPYCGYYKDKEIINTLKKKEQKKSVHAHHA